jgi:hypothetical protein
MNPKSEKLSLVNCRVKFLSSNPYAWRYHIRVEPLQQVVTAIERSIERGFPNSNLFKSSKSHLYYSDNMFHGKQPEPTEPILCSREEIESLKPVTNKMFLFGEQGQLVHLGMIRERMGDSGELDDKMNELVLRKMEEGIDLHHKILNIVKIDDDDDGGDDVDNNNDDEGVIRTVFFREKRYSTINHHFNVYCLQFPKQYYLDNWSKY